MALGREAWRTQMQSGSAGLTAAVQSGSVCSLSAFSPCVTTPRHPSFLERTSMPPRWKFFCKSKETMTSVLSPDHFGHLMELHTAIPAHSSSTWCRTHLLKPDSRASLLIQWLRIHLPTLWYSCLNIVFSSILIVL